LQKTSSSEIIRSDPPRKVREDYGELPLRGAWGGGVNSPSEGETLQNIKKNGVFPLGRVEKGGIRSQRPSELHHSLLTIRGLLEDGKRACKKGGAERGSILTKRTLLKSLEKGHAKTPRVRKTAAEGINPLNLLSRIGKGGREMSAL